MILTPRLAVRISLLTVYQFWLPVDELVDAVFFVDPVTGTVWPMMMPLDANHGIGLIQPELVRAFQALMGRLLLTLTPMWAWIAKWFSPLLPLPPMVPMRSPALPLSPGLTFNDARWPT